MDWIAKVETLVDEEGVLLLSEFEEGGPLLERISEFVTETSPSKHVVESILDLAAQVRTSTCQEIAQIWARNVVSTEMQEQLRDRVQLMEDKGRFLIKICREMLQTPAWAPFHAAIYSGVNQLLLGAIPLIEQTYPFHAKRFPSTLVHFRVKAFLSSCTLWMWDSLLTRSFSARMRGDPDAPKFPAKLLIPTLRRLGMADLLDNDWSMHGEWEIICTTLDQHADQPITKTDADIILNERSKIWRSARNSIRCRTMYTRGGVMASMAISMEIPPQSFQYFSKCSVSTCSNIETPEKPHSIRCKTCWYFHVCSPACEEYARVWDQHKCSITPPDKAAAIKAQTQAYLHLGENETGDEESDVNHCCSFCSAQEKDLDTKLKSCARCGTVQYCSAQCQRWDWTLGDHKLNCSCKK